MNTSTVELHVLYKASYGNAKIVGKHTIKDGDGRVKGSGWIDKFNIVEV